MFHPIGSQPPSVYWRRRLFLIGSLVLILVLVVLTINAVRSTGDGRANAGSPTSTGNIPSTARPVPSSTHASAPTSSPRTAKRSPTGSKAGRTTAALSTPPAADCVASNLQLRSVSGQSGYRIGDTPLLQLQVTNVGPQPCVQDLADKQVELRVYNGESRIWGSHDCKILPGVTDRTLIPKVSVLVSIKWSGLTSKPGACDPAKRQPVGAGTYTLYASLAGHQAHAGQFTVS